MSERIMAIALAGIQKLAIVLRVFGGLVCLGLALHAQAYEVTDDRGHTVRFEAPPQRIVTLLPSLTETVCELGACNRLVGVDRYSNSPAEVKKLPQVGGGLDPNIEAVVALRPDVVLLATSARVGERLTALGLRVLAFEPKSHADVQRVLRKVVQVLGQPTAEADRAWHRIDAAVSAAAQSLSPAAKNRVVFFEVGRGPYAAGESSFIGETLKRLGLRNAVPAAMGVFPRLSPEYLVRANPDLIMTSNRGADGGAPYPGWNLLPAVASGRVCHYTPAEGDTLVRAGPRMADAARWMAQCLNDKFGQAKP